MVMISGISLVVGAIVIANIMFVSVVERTNEIGLRPAIGARSTDIRRQFLLEATMLSTCGGLVGRPSRCARRATVDRFFPAEVRARVLPPGLLWPSSSVSSPGGALRSRRPGRRPSKLCATSKEPFHATLPRHLSAAASGRTSSSPSTPSASTSSASGLTTLGIVVGVTTVIAMVAIVTGSTTT